MSTSRIQQSISKLGPGLLFAGAAIGVSHLVQSTRAGAEFGWALVWAVIAVNLFKYPFFEVGPRYAMATGESLVQGYRRQGKWVLVAFLLVTILTVFTVQAAVTVVTAAIAQFVLPIGTGALNWSAIILLVCTAILVVGKYALLDRLIKWVIVILSASTIVALAAAMGMQVPTVEAVQQKFDFSDAGHIAFLIGLMGWMPAPIDLSVWHSIWAIEKKKLDPSITIKDSLFDLRAGYIGATVLAIVFLSMGAVMMHSTGQHFPPQAGAFAKALIGMYTDSLGAWAHWVIAIAVLSTMFSTTITCLDAIPRVLSSTFMVLQDKEGAALQQRLYWMFLAIVVIGALLLIGAFSSSMVALVQVATVLSFLTAPFFAFANYSLITGKYTPNHGRQAKPQQFSLPMRVLSWAGMVFLVGFSLVYLYTLL